MKDDTKFSQTTARKYRVGVRGNFTAIHALVGDVPEYEKHPHEHEYLLEWLFTLHSLDDRGFSLDIALLEKIRDTHIAEIRGVNLNDLPYFSSVNSSLENLCGFFFQRLSALLKDQLTAEDLKRIEEMEIRIWENDQAWAGLSAPITS